MTDHAHKLLTADELDTIGEIMNISMGSAATAVSTMLEKQVVITTPRLEQEQFKNIDNSGLKPALIIKIRYVEGIEGINAMMFRRRDMQIILDLLMGNDVSEEDENFEFDEMSMSAACEVMNQMMGASATALSEILERSINISTPEAMLVENENEKDPTFFEIEENQAVIAISFKMMIKGVLDSTFTCFLSDEFAAEIIKHVNGSMEELPEEQEVPVLEAAPPAPTSPVTAQPVISQPVEPSVQQNVPAQPIPEPILPVQQPVAPPVQMPPMPAAPPIPAAPEMYAQQTIQPQPMQQAQPPMQRPPMQFDVISPQQQGMPPAQQMPYGQQAAPYGYQPYMNYPPQQSAPAYAAPPQNIKNAEFPDFSKQSFQASIPASSNMGLLMGVQLEVSVIIGKTKRKIKDVMDFGQGTVIELDKQTGAPAEIMVNGQLLAYGDVIVVGDNFGIRITEIVGTKELLNSLDANM